MPRQYLTAEEFRSRKYFSMPNRQYDGDVLDEYLQTATVNVEQYTERIFEQQTYIEKFVGDGSLTWLAHEYPIISITSLSQTTLGTSPITTSATVADLIRTTQNDSIARIQLSGLDVNVPNFRTDAMYTLTYVGGYATIPVGVKHATGLWCAELLRMDYGATSQAPEIVPATSQQIVELLNPIRRRRIS